MQKMKERLFTKVAKDRSFETFQKRLNKVLNNPEKRTYVLELREDQQKQIYNHLLPHIDTSVYAEMEYVMVAIRTAYDVIIQRTIEEIEQQRKKTKKENGVQALGGHKSFSLKTTNENLKSSEEATTEEKDESSKDIKTKVTSRLSAFMDDGAFFERFIKHIVTNYQSLQKQRIDVLMVKNHTYQSFEFQLFDENYIAENGFKAAYNRHNQLVKAFYTTFDDLLFAGEILDTDEKINEQVIDVVLNEFQSKLTSKGSEINGKRLVLE